MRLRAALALVAATPATTHSSAYDTLTTTCQHATAISGELSVSSVAACKEKCDATTGCKGVDTNGSACYLKSHCEGTVGACKVWCGHRSSEPAPPPPAPLIPLREAAKRHGIHVGAAGNQGHIRQDATYAKVLAQQYSLVTAENACKWDSIHPGRHRFDFAPCDVVADFANAHSMAFRGHNLCWGNQNPGWLTGGSFPREELRAILKNHTQTVASYYGAKAIAWDVVNEAISNIPGGGLKPTIWYPTLPDYIDVAFNSTRSAYGGLLFYNDYNIASSRSGAEELHPRTGEVLTMGSRKKADALYSLVKGMLSRGVPIDGVGFQLHVQHTYSSFDGVAENMARLAALGLQVHITELDVKCPSDGNCDLDQQAHVYRELLRVCLAQPACTNFESWGFTDKYTWVGASNRPLPFDGNFQPKAAVREMLAEFANGTRTQTRG